MTTETKKPEQKEPKQPTPPVLVFGPAGSGKTALIDLMVKFFESTNVVDDFTLRADRSDGPQGERCRFSDLKPGTLYITNQNQTDEDIMHAGLGHGVWVISIYDVMVDLGRAKGKTMVEYTVQRFLTRMLKDAMGIPGPRRGGGAPTNGNPFA